MKDTASIPAHEQVAEFRVGAILATQAIAVYIDSDGFSRVHGEAGGFDNLPPRLKIRILAACEAEFRRRKEALIRNGIEKQDWRVADLGESLAPTDWSCSTSAMSN
jgi:hypothetical protein